MNETNVVSQSLSPINIKMPEGYETTKILGQPLTIFGTHIELEINGVVKAINHGDFLNILSKTLKNDTETRLLCMPANCYLWGMSATDLKLACYYPGKVREISHQSRDTGKNLKYKVAFPNVVINHFLKKNLDKWEWKDSRYYATSKNIGQLPLTMLTGQDTKNQIWTLPFSNVYADGRLCYGHNTVPRVFEDNFRGLDWHFAVLYNSPFNDDLGIQNLKTAKHPVEWYKKLMEQPLFPYELLKDGVKVTPVTSVAGDIMGANDTVTITPAQANGMAGLAQAEARLRPQYETLGAGAGAGANPNVGPGNDGGGTIATAGR